MSRDRKGPLMGLRPTKSDEDAVSRYRGINDLRRFFNGAVSCSLHASQAVQFSSIRVHLCSSVVS